MIGLPICNPQTDDRTSMSLIDVKLGIFYLLVCAILYDLHVLHFSIIHDW